MGGRSKTSLEIKLKDLDHNQGEKAGSKEDLEVEEKVAAHREIKELEKEEIHFVILFMKNRIE